MQFSPQQALAADAVGKWLKEPAESSQVFYLAGYAGTGKTTLAKYLAQLQSGAYGFAAYTGKAASVLTRKGCPATTIHSLIYSVKMPGTDIIRKLQQKITESTNDIEKTQLVKDLREANRPHFELNVDESGLLELDLLILDEVSMVNEQIAKDLLSFGKKILVLGDPGQLPPVEGAGYFTGKRPDIMLTEIHRQALNNPIIAMATMARQGNYLKPGRYGDSLVQRRASNTHEQLATASQVICGLNRTRNGMNALIRDWRGHASVACPEVGEKIICLRNDREFGILNGTMWNVAKSDDNGLSVELDLFDWDNGSAEKVIKISAHPFNVDLKDMAWYDRKRHQEFTFGYAITCHKAQGSQWDNVFIQNESYAFKENNSKWIYTALTRAENKVIVAQ
jgi:exodeoxyribonuclease-5